MAGSSFGTIFRVTTWGESHGKGIGVVVDGVPAGLPLTEEDIQPWLDRRRPGRNRFATQRQEADQVEILSGVFEGRTTGTPVSMMVRNTDQRSRDYGNIKDVYRPGHADHSFDLKYGFRDYRGGGRSSGRETLARTAAGAIAAKVLSSLGIQVQAFVSSVGPVSCSPERTDLSLAASSPLCMPDPVAEQEASAWLEQCIAQQTSSGGTVTCIISSMPPGIGEPVFDKLDALLGHALFSLGAVKAVEIGDGTQVSARMGHENNDEYETDSCGRAVKRTNHAGGILGGISDGSDVCIRVSFKPTPSISREQTALCTDGSVRPVSIHGRHDPLIAARACVVVEAMTAITLLDLMMLNMSSTIDGLTKFYK